LQPNRLKNICAIIWDLDGTLFDTRQKNFNVTKKIITKVKSDFNQFPALNSVTEYYDSHLRAANWRDFYRVEFHLSEDEIDEAGMLWTEFQLKDTTSVPPINGVSKVIKLLSFPQGIVSQNSKENIIQNLKQNNLDEYFQSIIGYEEVDLNKQKPDPAGLLKCIEHLCDSKSGNVFYIGDHETDLQTAKNANHFFAESSRSLKVISIAAAYSACFNSNNLKNNFDFNARTADDILKIISNCKS
jgi:HAD superfamily hydrolase (TIGR01549 family)